MVEKIWRPRSLQDIIDNEGTDNYTPLWVKCDLDCMGEKWHIAILKPENPQGIGQVLYFPKSNISIDPSQIRNVTGVLTMWDFLVRGMDLLRNLRPDGIASLCKENTKAKRWLESVRIMLPIIAESALGEPEPSGAEYLRRAL